MHGAEAFCDLLGGSKGRALICELSTPFPHAQLSAAANFIQQRAMTQLNVRFSFKVQRAVERNVALSYPATSFHRGSALNAARPHESSTRCSGPNAFWTLEIAVNTNHALSRGLLRSSWRQQWPRLDL